jgi:two-component system sensor histidine kinase ChvG
MSLRVPLVLLSLLTLLLPWAGCEYARQMETVLRKGQEDSLLTTARILGTVIGGDTTLIEQSFQAQSKNPSTLFAAQLLTSPLLDGFPDEWPQPTRPLPSEYSETANGASSNSSSNNSKSTTPPLRLGIYGSAIYAFVHVADKQVVYEIPRDEEQPQLPMDRVLLVSRDLTGIERAWSISAVAPGPVIVRSAAPQSPWHTGETLDDDIYGRWRATRDGFDIEIRIPQRLLGASVALVPLDNSLTEAPQIAMHALHTASDALREKLQGYAPAGVRISVVDSQGWLLARAGSLVQSAETPNEDSPYIYRWMLSHEEQTAPAYGLPYGMWGPPIDAARQGKSSAMWFDAGAGEPTTIRAAVPIMAQSVVDSNAMSLIGVVAVEQAADQLERERYAALADLLQFSFLATFLAVLATLGFAAWLLRRIRRLSIAATNALTPEGRIEQRLPETQARDELGDLARNFASLLHRINEYASYLQTLGSKLSHEFRTPLAIVSSSLDNLAADNAADDLASKASRKQFVDRARDGTLRLQSILSAMTEATRVEQSIEQAEQVEFDLRDLLRSAGTAYQQTFSTHRIETVLPESVCPMRGAPELIAQLLDKLIDNAVDFCPKQGLIRMELGIETKQYRLIVSNEGPLLAPDAESKIFDMLVSNRAATSAKPHLGLGLYIVQLIARFHRGAVQARNLPDATGVVFEITLAR